MSNPPTRPPAINGVNASTVLLLAGPWPTLLDALCTRFPYLTRERWADRFARGRVLDTTGGVLAGDTPHVGEIIVHYYREVFDEAAIPFEETIVHTDTEIVIADKPHFLPVTPAGRHVEETLLARLIRRYDEPNLVPLHRIDAATAGLVMFSRNPATRSAYQALFREHRIVKVYQAVARSLRKQSFPLTRHSRIVRGDPFYRMQEAEGVPNAETSIDAIERGEHRWRYQLMPVTGRQHQLRVQMAALGAPLCNDDIYPVVDRREAGDYARPLQLLAQSLEFDDPVSGERRHFASSRSLLPLDDS
ncbi:MAG: pseudouridine synthase [Dokdonella sp.]